MMHRSRSWIGGGGGVRLGFPGCLWGGLLPVARPWVAGVLFWVCMSFPGQAGEGKRLMVEAGYPMSGGQVTEMASALAFLKQVRVDSEAFLVVPAQRLRFADEISRVFGHALGSGVPVWFGIRARDVADLGELGTVIPESVAGVLLIFQPLAAAPLPKESFEELLALKRAGDRLGGKIRECRDALPPGVKLAVAADVRETAPGTGRGVYVPVSDLVRGGAVDAVCLMGGTQVNYHRLRLSRDAPLHAGCGIDVQGAPSAQRAALFERLVLEAQGNRTCSAMWLFGDSVRSLVYAVQRSLAARRAEEARQAQLEADIAAGRLVLDQGVEAAGANDQATVHGVAQSFVPSRDGTCPLVRVYAALRGVKGALPPPLALEIREDAGGSPGSEALVRAKIPPTAFGHEPAYRWAQACFDPPAALRQGRRYWLYFPDSRSAQGVYVWRLRRNGASERGAAWSRTYDYGAHSWVFSVYLSGADGGVNR